MKSENMMHVKTRSFSRMLIFTIITLTVDTVNKITIAMHRACQLQNIFLRIILPIIIMKKKNYKHCLRMNESGI